jgi:hypothetical protein
VATGVSDPGLNLQVVLPGTGAAVLRTGARVFVTPAGSATFGAPQDLGGKQEDHLLEPDARLVPTSKGELIASVLHSEGFETTAVLPAGGTSFGSEQEYPSFDPFAGQPVTVAADTQGNAFLADLGTSCADRSQESVLLARRPPGGAFRTATVLSCRSISSANPFPVLSAGGGGGLALLTITGSRGHYALVAQTGRGGRLGAPHVLARSARLPAPLGPPVINLGGGVTAAWPTCAASGTQCTVTAAQGSLGGGTWRTRTFTHSGGVGGQVGNSYVALSHCHGAICEIQVSLVDRRGRFGNPRTLTRDGQFVGRDELVEASGGRRRERAILWTSSRRGLFASVSDPGRPGFGPIRRLSPDGSVSHNQVSYQTGPRDQAIATWLSPNGTANVTVYSP